MYQKEGNLVQKGDWIKISIRKEKRDRIKNILNHKIWNPAKHLGLENESQFIDFLLEEALWDFEKIEWEDKAAETRDFYDKRKIELKREYGITSYTQYLNFLISQKESKF